jgi:ABC-type branched-subunit amino acid transport system ATPase component
MEILIVFNCFKAAGAEKSVQTDGEQQMLSIGVGLMGIPVLLMLEPSLGLAPKIKDELTIAIRELHSRSDDDHW